MGFFDDIFGQPFGGMFDFNGDGKTDDGTKRDAIFRMIDSLPISSEAKDGLALIDYGMKSIRKNAPWH